ncbi:MAG: peptide deformylase [Oscillospiraceae bacterium]|nr:peptide deformylase [Oscillospiraceae bacterium]
MAIRNILRGNDPALLKTSRIITDFNKRLHMLLDDMRETLVEANGLGLASPQVGVLRRAVLIVDTEIADKPMEEQIIEMVNPEIIEECGEQTGNEGCLSVPGVYGIVTRPERVKVKAQDRYGNYFELLLSNTAARAACHEVDHLNGVIFTSLAERFLTEEELDRLAEDRTENEQDNEQKPDL